MERGGLRILSLKREHFVSGTLYRYGDSSEVSIFDYFKFFSSSDLLFVSNMFNRVIE